MPSEPTIGELSRRLDALTDEVRTGYRGLNERLDRMPTSELLTAYLDKVDTDVRSLKEDVLEVKDNVRTIEQQAKNDVAALEKKITEAKRWAIGALISGGGLLVAVVQLIRSFT